MIPSKSRLCESTDYDVPNACYTLLLNAHCAEFRQKLAPYNVAMY